MEKLKTLGLLAIEKSPELTSNNSKLIQFKVEPDLSLKEIFEELKKLHVSTLPEYVDIANQVSPSPHQLQSVVDRDITHHDTMKIISTIIQELKNLSKDYGGLHCHDYCIGEVQNRNQLNMNNKNRYREYESIYLRLFVET